MSHDKEFKLYNENDFSEEFTLEYVRFDIDKKDISILNENLTMVLKDEFSSKIKFDIISIHAMLLNPSFEAYVKSMKNTKEKLLIFSYFIQKNNEIVNGVINDKDDIITFTKFQRRI